MTKQPDKVKDLMFKSLSKAKLLTAEQELDISRSCRAAKIEVWNQIFSKADVKRVIEILDYAQDNMSIKNRSLLDDSSFEDLVQRTKSLVRSNTNYRYDMWDTVRLRVAAEISNRDVCLQMGAKFLSEMKSAEFDYSHDWISRVQGAWDAFVKLRNEFIEKNMRLVISIGKRYRGFSLPYEDLIQEGMFGLQRAIDLFDPERGFKFSTYSSWWIRAAIQRYCRDKGRVVRIPVHMQEAFEKYVEAKTKHGTDMGDIEIAEALGVSSKKIHALKSMHAVDYFSLDAKIGHDSDACLGDTLPSDGAEFKIAEVNLDMELVSSVLKDLPDRERYIIECRFGLNGNEEQTLQEIATQYDMSRERIRQLQVKAMGELRRRIKRRAESVQAGLRCFR